MRVFASILFIALAPVALAQGAWRNEGSLGPWSERGHHNVEVFDGRLWSFNGSAGAMNQSDLWSSSDGTAWQQEQSGIPWLYRDDAATAVFNGRMWMMGGTDNGFIRNDVWSTIDGVNWVQETTAAQWQERGAPRALNFDGKMWVMGGVYYDPPAPIMVFNDVWSTTDGINWTREVASAAWPARFNHQCVVYNNRMWVMGGWDFQTVYNDVWSSDDGINWVLETAAAPWTPRDRFSAVSYGGRIWVIGGEEPGGFLYGDVWSSADGKNWRYEGQPWVWHGGAEAAVFNGRLWLIGGGMSLVLNPIIPEAAGIWSYGVHVHETTLPMGRVDVAYSANVEARGGEGPYSWTLTGGALPPGLALGASTTELLPISGTPTQSGQFTFTLRVEESSGDYADETITLLIQPVPASGGNGGNSGGLGCTPATPGLGILALLLPALFRRRRGSGCGLAGSIRVW